MPLFFQTNDYFWMVFIYESGTNPEYIIESAHLCFNNFGMNYRFHKGNDGQLNYTIVDRNSGKKWMLKLFEEIRDSSRTANQIDKYIAASYEGNFFVPRLSAYDSGIGLESGELLFMIRSNGFWLLRQDTFSLIVFCSNNGILGSGEEPVQRQHFKSIVELGKRIWCETMPLFSWMDFSSTPYSEAPQQISKGGLPSSAWITICSNKMLNRRMLERLDSSIYMVYEWIGGGDIFIENTKCRKGKFTYF